MKKKTKAKEREKSVTEKQSVFSKLAPELVETFKRYYNERADYKDKWLLAGILNTFQDASQYARRIREAMPELEVHDHNHNVYLQPFRFYW